MRSWCVAPARLAGAGGSSAVAGGSGPGGQAGPPTSQPAAPTAPVDRPEGDHVQTHPHTHCRGHAGSHDAGRHDRRHPRPATDEQAARRPPTQSQVGEAWHQPQVAPAGPEVAGDARRPPTEGQVAEPWRDQTNVPARPVERDGQPGWRLASLGFLAAALALAGGLAVHAATRPGRSTRVGPST
jgi:hypothetical protein